MDLGLIEQSGLSKNEAKIYITLLREGEATASKIAVKSGLYRPYVYDKLANLIEKGLASYVIKSGKKHFQPSHPKKLLDVLKEKERNISSILPELEQIHDSRKKNILVEVYEGKEGLKTHFENIFNSAEQNKTKELFIIGTSTKIDSLLKYYFPNLVKRAERIILKNKIKAKSLRNHHFKKQKISSMLLPQKYKYLPNNCSLKSTIVVFGDTVAFEDLNDRPSVVEIQNENIADSIKKMFNLIWSTSRE